MKFDFEWSDLSWAAALVLLAFSIWTFRKKQPALSVTLLVLCGFFLRLYVSLDPFLHEWDEQFHALVAKNLIHHPLMPTLYDNPLLPYNYKDWSVAHVWLHKPPLTTWLIALSLRFFGINTLAVRLPSLLFSTLSVFLTYIIGKKLFDEKIGWMAAFFQSINGFLIAVAGGRIPTDHVDTIFLFFCELAFWFAILFRERKNLIFLFLFSLSLILAIYTKWLVAGVLIPVWLSLNFDMKFILKSCLQLGLIVFLVAAAMLPWQLYIFYQFPLEAKWESDYNLRHFTSVIEGHDGPWYFYIVRATMNWSELIWLAVIWFIVAAVRKKLQYPFLIILILFFIPYIIFSIANTKMEGYVIVAAPATFLILAYWWWDTLEIAKRRKKLRLPIFILLVATILLSVRYAVERMKPLQHDKEEMMITQEIQKLPEKFPNSKTVIFNTRRYIQIMFFTPFVAYRDMPSRDELGKLELEGYHIVVIDDGNLSDEIKKDSSIRVVRL